MRIKVRDTERETGGGVTCYVGRLVGQLRARKLSRA